MLDFAIQVLQKGAAADDIISPLIVFSIQYIMVNHVNWKYKECSRWKTTLRVWFFIILYVCLFNIMMVVRMPSTPWDETKVVCVCDCWTWLEDARKTAWRRRGCLRTRIRAGAR